MRIDESGNGKEPFAIHFLHRSEPFGDGNILCDGGNAIVDDQDIVGSKGVGRKKEGIGCGREDYSATNSLFSSAISSGVSRVMLMLKAA